MSTLRGGFDRGPGGSAEATAGAQYAAMAQAAMELARAWAQAAEFVEPDPENYPGRFSAFHYALRAAGGQWFRGPGVPSVLLGEDGNYYLDELTGDLYQKVAGIWVLAINITGPGVPSGGTADYVLAKVTSNSFDTEWRKAGVPSGGVRDQILTKLSDTSGDYGWTSILSPVNKRVIQVACSDLTTAITAGVNKGAFRAPLTFEIQEVRASLLTAQASGSVFTVDINKNGVSILSTKLTIDNTEKTSKTAATPAVISDSTVVDDDEITIDIDQVGDAVARGLVVTIIGA